jgi:hypothetical protein
MRPTIAYFACPLAWHPAPKYIVLGLRNCGTFAVTLANEFTLRTDPQHPTLRAANRLARNIDVAMRHRTESTWRGLFPSAKCSSYPAETLSNEFALEIC